MMMYLKGPWPLTHVRVMGMQSADPLAGYILNAHGNFSLESLVDKFNGGGTTPVVTDKWICIEWDYDAPAGGAVDTHFWLDGTEITPPPAGFPQVELLNFWVGYKTARMSAPTEMWLDDIALGSTRVGCPAH
jgi:hypothetical protein